MASRRPQVSKSDIVIRIGGEGGEGVISTGDMFTVGAARTGFRVFTFRTYPAEIKGGHAWYQVRVSNEPVRSIGDGIDVLIAFDDEAYHRHIDEVNPEGVVIYDPDRVREAKNGNHVAYPIPLQKIAREQLEFQRGKNVLTLGIMAGLFGLAPTPLEDLVRSRLKRRAELLSKNIDALHFGYEYTQQIRKEDRYYLGTSDHVSRLVMSGNDAIVAGALHAGCRYYAGYPITPASEILEVMARELPKVGGVFLQGEDEMASLASVIGASFAGAKAMTATSGPGFSLMTELMGLSAMTDIPCVIVDAQRAGPSTGMPTKLEQGDLYQALYGGHGDFPRIVVAPSSVEDCIYQMVSAFNLSEEYQLPAIFLSDQSLSHRTESLQRPDFERLKVVDRARPSPDELEDYQRYRITESGVSPMAIPALDEKGTYVAPGLEHDEKGSPNLAPAVHEAMTQKRFRKLATLSSRMDPAPRYGARDPEVGIIGWGATEGAIMEAVDRATAEGHKVASLHPRILNPLPEGQIDDFIRSVNHVIIPEVNYQGQFAHHIGATFGVKPVRLNKYGGLPFTPGEIFRKIEEVLGNGH
jgi:2-oxoglutarate ferredoxin oxidoreductase subunit alpha